MSAYTTLLTRIVSVEHLLKALEDLGLGHGVQVHKQPMPLYDWMDQARPQKADVIIDRRILGQGANDIGFARGADGIFRVFISEYDQHAYGAEWLQRLTQRYAYHVARDELEAQGFDLVHEEQDADQTLRLTLRRMG